MSTADTVWHVGCLKRNPHHCAQVLTLYGVKGASSRTNTTVLRRCLCSGLYSLELLQERQLAVVCPLQCKSSSSASPLSVLLCPGWLFITCCFLVITNSLQHRHVSHQC